MMAESIDNVFADEMYARAKKRAQQRVKDRKRCEKRRLERAKKISMKRKRERELMISTIQTSSARATEVSCVKEKRSVNGIVFDCKKEEVAGKRYYINRGLSNVKKGKEDSSNTTNNDWHARSMCCMYYTSKQSMVPVSIFQSKAEFTTTVDGCAITVAIVDQTAQPYAKDKSNNAALKCKDKRQEASLSCDI